MYICIWYLIGMWETIIVQARDYANFFYFGTQRDLWKNRFPEITCHSSNTDTNASICRINLISDT